MRPVIRHEFTKRSLPRPTHVVVVSILQPHGFPTDMALALLQIVRERERRLVFDAAITPQLGSEQGPE